MIFIFRMQQLDANPHEEHGTNQFEVWHAQQGERERNQDDAQDDSANRTPDDAFDALRWRQAATSQGNDNRVIPTQQNVNDDDLTKRGPK
jgi:hypothetical protein